MTSSKSTTKFNNGKIAIFKRKVLRNIFGPLINVNLGEKKIIREKKNEDLYDGIYCTYIV